MNYSTNAPYHIAARVSDAVSGGDTITADNFYVAGGNLTKSKILGSSDLKYMYGKPDIGGTGITPIPGPSVGRMPGVAQRNLVTSAGGAKFMASVLPGSPDQLWLNMSFDGSDWVSLGSITGNPGYPIRTPTIATDNNNMTHLVWIQSDGGPLRVWHAKYSILNGSFEPLSIKIISSISTPYSAYDPCITVGPAGDIIVGFRRNNTNNDLSTIYYLWKGVGGAWSTDNPITEEGAGFYADCYYPTMVLGEDNVFHAAYIHDDIVCYTNSTIHSWPLFQCTDAIEITSGTPNSNANLCMAVGFHGMPHLSWDGDDGSGSIQVFLWTPSQTWQLTTETGVDHVHPSLAIPRYMQVYIAYERQSTASDIYLLKNINGDLADGWSEKRITWDGINFMPNIKYARNWNFGGGEYLEMSYISGTEWYTVDYAWYDLPEGIEHPPVYLMDQGLDETERDSYFHMGLTEMRAQQFQPTVNSISLVSFLTNFDYDVVTPDYYNIYLQGDDGGFPDGITLANGTIPLNDITYNSWEWAYCWLDYDGLVPEDHYWLVIEGFGPDTDNVRWGIAGTGSKYTRGDVAWHDGANWNPHTYDHIFATYYDEPYQYLSDEGLALDPFRGIDGQSWKPQPTRGITLNGGPYVDQKDESLSNPGDQRTGIELSTPSWGQSFVPTVDSICAVEFYLKQDSTGTNKFSITIFEDAGGTPAWAENITYGVIDCYDIGLSYDWVRCWFDTEGTLVPYDTYWIYVQPHDGGTPTTVYWKNDWDGSYPNGTAALDYDPWTPMAWDFLFRTLYNQSGPGGGGFQDPEIEPPIRAVQGSINDPLHNPAQRRIIRTENGDLYYCALKAELTYGTAGVYMYKSTDDGETWECPSGVPGEELVSIHPNAGFACNPPSIAVDEWGTIHIVWCQPCVSFGIERVYYRYFNTTNQTFRPNVQEASAPFGAHATNVTIAVSHGNMISIAWIYNFNPKTLYTRSKMWNNPTWGTQEQVNDGTDFIYKPTILFDSNDNMFILCHYDDSGLKIGFFNYTGPTLGVTPVTDGTENAWNVSAVIGNDDYIHLVYESKHLGGGDRAIRYRAFHASTGPGISQVGQKISPDGTDYKLPILTTTSKGLLACYMLSMADWNVYMVRGRPGSAAAWETGLTQISSNGDNVGLTVPWSSSNYNPVMGDIDLVYVDIGGDMWLVKMDLTPLSIDWAATWIEPIANGWFTNGSKANETLQVKWWVDIPFGTPEGTYIGTITYIIEATDELTWV